LQRDGRYLVEGEVLAADAAGSFSPRATELRFT